jgi:hypothetical protein
MSNSLLMMGLLMVLMMGLDVRLVSRMLDLPFCC